MWSTNFNINANNESITNKRYCDTYYASLASDNVFEGVNNFANQSPITSLCTNTNINTIGSTALPTKGYCDAFYSRLVSNNTFGGINSFTNTAAIICNSSVANISSNFNSLVTKTYYDIHYLHNSNISIGCQMITNTAIYPIYTWIIDFSIRSSLMYREESSYLLLPSYKI